MRRFVAVLIGFLVAPLALEAQKSKKPDLLVDLRFVPQDNVATEGGSVALPAALIDRSVELRVQDSRNQSDAQLLGEGTDGDDRFFPIRASVDIVQFVGDALRRIGETQALKIASPPERMLDIRLTRFAVNEGNKAVGSTYAAEVHLAFTLKDADGRTLTEGASSGQANRYGRARSAANCSEVLSDALKEAFIKTLDDDSLQAAWMSGEPSSARPQPSSDGQSAPITESIEERLEKLDELLRKGVISEEEHRAARIEILKGL